MNRIPARLTEFDLVRLEYREEKHSDGLGITQIKFHDLRATFITNLLSQGESLAKVMAIVGHADMETNVYVRKAGVDLKGGTPFRLSLSQPRFELIGIKCRI